MTDKPDYVMHTDVMFGALSKIDVPALVEACTDPWWNQTLCQVNDCVARLGIIEGEFHWHKHDDEDELFFVLEGRLFVDVQSEEGEQSVELLPHQGFTVPRGVVHRTRAPEKTVMLMVERAGVVPTGD